MMEPAKTIKGILILNSGGNVLFHLINDEECLVNPSLLGSFCAALAQLGQENLGQIKEINIKGLDLNMVLVTQHNLIMIALLDPGVPVMNVREEAERALSSFHQRFQDTLENWNGDQAVFETFREEIEDQVKLYLQKVSASKEGLFNKLLDIYSKKATG